MDRVRGFDFNIDIIPLQRALNKLDSHKRCTNILAGYWIPNHRSFPDNSIYTNPFKRFCFIKNADSFNPYSCTFLCTLIFQKFRNIGFDQNRGHTLHQIS